MTIPRRPAGFPADPRVRRDGKCAKCKGDRPLPKLMPVSESNYARDPFCSRPCCEAHHGTAEPPRLTS